MRICVIHGSNRQGNTDYTIEITKKQLNTLDQLEYTDIYLPRDLPHFCNGCFACLRTGDYGGQNCPHWQFTHPIISALKQSDGIIIASPSYALAESAQVKALFDHLACTYINHRPNLEMFDKTALILTTAAGAGTKRVVSTIWRNLLFWGVKRIISCRINIWYMNWQEMPSHIRIAKEAKVQRAAKKFYRLTKKRYHLRRTIPTIFLHTIFKRLIQGYAEEEPDKIYWRKQGWL